MSEWKNPTEQPKDGERVLGKVNTHSFIHYYCFDYILSRERFYNADWGFEKKNEFKDDSDSKEFLVGWKSIDD